jgi:Spy/CpxP family protein refolding chaperone
VGEWREQVVNVKTLVWLVVILAVINIAALGTIVYERLSAPSHRMFFPGPEQKFEGQDGPMPRMLDLTPEQREALRRSRDSLADQMKAFHDELNAKRQQLFTEMGKDDPDTQLVYRLVDEIGQIQTDMQKQVVGNMLKDGAILDPHQREMLLRSIERRSFNQARQLFDRPHGGMREKP